VVVLEAGPKKLIYCDQDFRGQFNIQYTSASYTHASSS